MRPIVVSLCLAAAACAPPPEVVVPGLDDTAAGAPLIEILYPENGQQIELDASCHYTDLLIVNVENFELDQTLIDQDPVGGIGHWHGGPDLVDNYCLSGVAFCVADDRDPAIGEFDGTILSPGRITLQVQLQTNDHTPVGEIDQVEIELIEPQGGCP